MTVRQLILRFTLVQSLHWFSWGAIFPILMLMMLAKEVALGQVGMALGAFSFTVLLLEFPTGNFSDVMGRKRVFILSLLIFIGGGVFFLFAKGFGLILTGCIFLGISQSLYSGSLDAWFVEEYLQKGKSYEDLQRVLGRVGFFPPVCLGVGTLVGGLLPDLLGDFFEAHTLFDRFAPNLILLDVVLLVELLVVVVLVKEEASATLPISWREGLRKVPDVMRDSFRVAFRSRMMVMLLVGIFGYGLGSAGLFNYWQPQMKSFLEPDAPTWLFGVVAAGYGVAGGLGSAFSPLVVKWLGGRYWLVMMLFRIVEGLSFLVLAFVGSLAGFIGWFAFSFFIEQIMASPEQTMVNQVATGKDRSAMLSLLSFFREGGRGIGGFAVGIVAGSFGIPPVLMIGAGVMVVSAWVYWEMRRLRVEADQGEA